MNAASLQPAAVVAALQVGVFVHLRCGGARGLARFVASLALGAALARVGWALAAGRPDRLLALEGGFTLLAVPLGPLLLARHEAALRALPLACAVAKLGCVAAGCCAPRWVSVAEAAALALLHVGVSCTRAGLAPFGVVAIRLAAEPLRFAAAPLHALGPPIAWAAGP